MPKIPDSTKASLHQRLIEHSRERWPQLSEIRLRYRAGFAYIDGVLADDGVLRLWPARTRHAAVSGGAYTTPPHAKNVQVVCPPTQSQGWCRPACGRRRAGDRGQRCGGRTIHEPSVQRTSSPTAGMYQSSPEGDAASFIPALNTR